MNETLQQKIILAEKKGDLIRLRQLRDALTKNRGISHYAGLPAGDAQRAAEIAEAAIARLTPRPRKKREKKPVELEFTGLVQDDLFADLGRWPRKPYCTNNFELEGLQIRSLKHALHKSYIQPNPPHLRVWAMFDLDYDGAANAWQDADLPPPSWTSVNRQNGHAHSVWGLSAPVLTDGLGARDAPMRYLAAVEAMMRERLKADLSYANLVTKNPAHPIWQTLRGPRMAYQLSELAEALPGIEKFKPRGRVDNIGLGRNVNLFDGLRKWAYKAIRDYWKGSTPKWEEWVSACNNHALVLNGDFKTPLDGREVWHVAKSVAKWTRSKTTEAGFSKWQSVQGTKGGKASGKARAAASENKRASARLMANSGMSMRAIAEELKVGKSTVSDWLK